MGSSAVSSQMLHTKTFCPPAACFLRMRSGWLATTVFSAQTSMEELTRTRTLTHLHDKAKYVCIVIEHNPSTDVCIKLACGVRHYTGGEVPFDLTEKFVMNYYLLRWKFHRSRIISLHPPEHDSIGDEA